MPRAAYQHQALSNRCECCVKFLKWIPVVFIFLIISWSYYAFAIQLCIYTIPNISGKILLLFCYHIVIFMFLWSYYQTIFTEVADIPLKFHLPATELEKLYTVNTEEEQKNILNSFSLSLPITNQTTQGTVRFCEKCQLVKPDRAHHCSVCGKCVLKMDHHCPWINSCVCFNNYKFFILFLGYALVYCLFIACSSLPYFVQFWKGDLEGAGRFHILFLFFVSVMFAISLVSLFGYHIYLILVNRTTLEAFRPPLFRNGVTDKNGYNLGCYKNFCEVFGYRKLLWFLPIFTSVGDGIQYTIQSNHLSSYESMSITQQLHNSF